MMNTIRGFLVSVLLLAAALTWAQLDPRKVLPGTWEGQAGTLRGGDMILVINSVEPADDGEWVARGRFGPRESIKTGPGGQEMAVKQRDNEIHLEFVTKDKNPVRLKLVNENKLEGTINIILKRAVNRKVEFVKVVPKAGDMK
jgi:hypothetical protein